MRRNGAWYYVTLPRERRPPLPFLPPSLLPLLLLLLLLQGPTSSSFDISAGVQRLTDRTRARLIVNVNAPFAFHLGVFGLSPQ